MEHGTWRGEKELAQIYGWFKLLLGRASKTGCWLYMQPGELGSAAMPNLARHKFDWSPAKMLLAIYFLFILEASQKMGLVVV